MSYEIRSDRPVPSHIRRKYPFGQMSVGDSFEIDLSDYNSASSGANVFGRKNGMKFCIRKIDRQRAVIWRIE